MRNPTRNLGLAWTQSWSHWMLGRKGFDVPLFLFSCVGCGWSICPMSGETTGWLGPTWPEHRRGARGVASACSLILVNMHCKVAVLIPYQRCLPRWQPLRYRLATRRPLLKEGGFILAGGGPCRDNKNAASD